MTYGYGLFCTIRFKVLGGPRAGLGRRWCSDTMPRQQWSDLATAVESAAGLNGEYSPPGWGMVTM
jgi:hypothetical protein